VDAGLPMVGIIPRSLPLLFMSLLSKEAVCTLFMPAFAMAILGVVEAYSIAKSFSSKVGDKINANQEFIGQGLANVSLVFFSASSKLLHHTFTL